MFITIPTTGSRGDVQPYVALGAALQARGHRVRLATHADFEGLARRHGLDFFPIEAGGRALHASDAGARMVGAGANPFVFLREFARMRRPLLRELMTNCRAACAGADLILLSPTALGVGQAVAERLSIPTCWTSLQPAAASRYLPNFLFPEVPAWLPGSGSYNLLTHVLAGQTLWQLLRSALNEARRDVLDLPPLPPWGPVREVFRYTPRLHGYSPVLVPPPPDWGDNHHVTGFWFLDASAGWRPPPDLEAFLADGPPPVYVGFGSMHDRDAPGLTALVLEALEQTGQRGLLHVGWGGLAAIRPTNRVFPVAEVPHHWLFPRTATIVTHGGAGTVGAAARAGVPAVVVPFMCDQPFWGRRLHDHGVSPRAIPRKRLTAGRLAAAVASAVADPDLRARAAALGAKVRAEDGVGRCAEIISRHDWRAEAPPARHRRGGATGQDRTDRSVYARFAD